MTKFSVKRKRLDFMEGWSTLEHDMQGEEDDQPDLLAEFSSGVSGGLDRIIAEVGQDDEPEE